MERKDKNVVKTKREKEIETRIIRDNPQPISIGNGVHREESKLAEIASKEDTARIKRKHKSS